MRLSIIVGVLLGFFSLSAQAAPLVVDPTTGLDSKAIDQRFFWSSIGPIDSIGTPGGGGAAYDPYWEITVGVDSTIDLVSAMDGFEPGDSFELVFDGDAVAWDATGTDGGGYFFGEIYDLFLAAGTHLFSINVLPGSLSSGGAWLNFSAVSDVPLPAALPLFLVGLAGFGVARRKKKA